MLALILAVLASSLLGSLHCAGMCGGFAAIASAPRAGPGVGTGARSAVRGARPGPLSLTAAYNLGRLITYLALGALAGLAGHAIDLAGGAWGLQRVAAALAGGVMVVFGGLTIARIAGARLPAPPAPEFIRRALVSAHSAVFGWGPLARALAVGLLTTLLPCGWLYAFVAAAGGTGAAWAGAITMAVFWLGTLPMMAALGLGVQSLLGPLRRHMPLATSLMLVAVGLFTISGRVGAPDLSGLDADCCGPGPVLPGQPSRPSVASPAPPAAHDASPSSHAP